MAAYSCSYLAETEKALAFLDPYSVLNRIRKQNPKKKTLCYNLKVGFEKEEKEKDRDIRGNPLGGGPFIGNGGIPPAKEKDKVSFLR